LTVGLRNKEDEEVTVEPFDKKQTHRLIRYKWNEKLKYEFVATLSNDGCLICKHENELSLQKEKNNNAVNILYRMVKRDGNYMR
jgi:hypothetical protein